MKKWYEKSLEKGELKQRAKLGDKAFLEKSIKTYTNNNKLFKIFLPAWLILSIVSLILNSVHFAETSNIFSLISIICWSVAFLCWVFLAVIYYSAAFKVNDKKINEWKEELKKYEIETLNKAE